MLPLIVEIVDRMEKQRSGVRQAVEPVQYAAVPRQQMAAVLDADIPFEG